MSESSGFENWLKNAFSPYAQKHGQRDDILDSTSGWPPAPADGPHDFESYAEYLEWHKANIGWPGEYPYTRGITPTGYRGKLWTMRQYAGFSTAKETNERYHFLLEAGQTGLSVAFDLPTQMGYASDDQMALGEVGKVGVPIDTIDDMRTLFNGIPLGKVSTSMTINAPAAILLGFYQVVAEEAGVPSTSLRGTIQNDILKEYMARGTYIFPPAPSMKLTVDCFRYCMEHLPKWNSISISGYHIREAGCTAVQEVAFTLADAIAYCEAAVSSGLAIDDFAPRLSFFFNAHNNFLEEVAKFRAARRLWAKIARDRFGAKDPKSMLLRFHTQTAGSMLTAQQPLNNVVRTAYQALAAVLGGTQSLHTNSYDEALALPTQQSVEIALRTQQIMAYESGVADTVDPLAGSYFIEDLTGRIEAESQTYISKIDEMGGMVRAIENGFPQREIQNSAYRWQRQVESGERTVVGVNAFKDVGDTGVPIRKHNELAEIEQVKRLNDYIESRDEYKIAKLDNALGELKRACEAGTGMVDRIVGAIRAGATEGEIAGAMVEIWGRFYDDTSV